jgi:hypothetical protein
MRTALVVAALLAAIPAHAANLPAGYVIDTSKARALCEQIFANDPKVHEICEHVVAVDVDVTVNIR